MKNRLVSTSYQHFVYKVSNWWLSYVLQNPVQKITLLVKHQDIQLPQFDAQSLSSAEETKDAF